MDVKREVIRFLKNHVVDIIEFISTHALDAYENKKRNGENDKKNN